MRIPGRRALYYSARLVRARLVRHALILGYHRVEELPWDPFRLCVSPERFAQQLEVLGRYANVISLPELAAARASGKIVPRSVVITFDDGYKDYLNVAKPLLDKAGFPSTIFIATGYIGEEFWWDTVTRLATSLDPAAPLDLTSGSARYEWRPNGGAETADRSALLRSLHRFLLALGPDERAACLERLVDPADSGSSERQRNLAMTPAEVASLVPDAGITIGAHTVSHTMLAQLPHDRQRDEILQSRQTLEAITGRPVTSFSFPHGSKSDTAMRLVRECGFSHACASQNDVVWRNSNPYCLPRIWVPDCTGDAFRKLLLRWL